MKKAEEKANEEKDKTKEFEIKVTYEKGGKSFQSIAESILLRKLNEM